MNVIVFENHHNHIHLCSEERRTLCRASLQYKCSKSAYKA